MTASTSQIINTQVNLIKAFSDNYIWAISANSTDEITLVDPGEASVCIHYIEQQRQKNSKSQLTAILITHHHSDHIGGIAKLINYCQQQEWPLAIYIPKDDGINIPVQPNENVKVKKVAQDSMISLAQFSAPLTVLSLPGHTLGHIAYYNEELLFCGDTLFSGGCGRLFEGTPTQMQHSIEKLSQLNNRTKVYCAHEYTQSNLDFAKAVEPNNIDLIEYQEHVKTLRLQNLPTIPSTIGIEKRINPFLRCHKNDVKISAQRFSGQISHSVIDTFSIIRSWKDQFKST